MTPDQITRVLSYWPFLAAVGTDRHDRHVTALVGTAAGLPPGRTDISWRLQKRLELLLRFARGLKRRVRPA